MSSLCLILVLWIGSQGTDMSAAQHLQAGIAARERHEIVVAIAEFRRAAEMDPNLADAFFDLGAAYMEAHDYGSAIAPLKKALELNPEMDSAELAVGYALLAQGYAAEAIPHLRKASVPEALGIAQIETGNLPEAVVNLQAAFAKRPDDPDLLYYLGHAAGLLSKESMDTLIAKFPESPRAHQALAENYFVLRQMPEAEKEFREALRLRPDLPRVHLELGLVYAGAAQWPKAEEEFRAEAKLQPGSAEAAYRLGAALLQQGRSREALVELKRSSGLKADMPETLYSLGKAASLAGDSETAEQAWTQVIEIEKDGSMAAQAHFGLAALYRKQGKTEQARREMKEFQRLQAAASPAASSPRLH
jgi:tetratricopeptide (TPR) repeat protein